jgi:hypothetical protein
MIEGGLTRMVLIEKSPFKVVVIDCAENRWWYSSKIGTTFFVRHPTSNEKKGFYIVTEEGNGKGYRIHKKEAIKVKSNNG